MKWNSSSFSGRMAEILRAFPNVNWVCLQGFPAYPSLTEPCETSYVELDRIETLVLKDGNYEGGTTFVEEILFAFHNVRRLECEKLTFTTGSSPKPLELGYRLLPRLKEISLHNPRRPLVELITARLSVKNIQRLSLKSSKGNIDRAAHWEQLVNKMRSNHQYFSLELSKTMGGPQGKACNVLLDILSLRLVTETWNSCNLNAQNIHTLIFNINILTNLMGCSEASWIPEAMHGIKIPRLRRLVFNIEVYNTGFFSSSFLCWWPKDRITSALDSHELSGYLEEIVVNFRSNDKGTSVSNIREALDPEGRRKWWERGMLKVNVEHTYSLNLCTECH
jgi:hypothetical protein